MKCPHCQQGIHQTFHGTNPVSAGDSQWNLLYMTCPECLKAIIRLARKWPQPYRNDDLLPAYPPTDSLRPVPPEVPDPYKQDFIEACEVLSVSPKASAALSRRNLQAVLRDKAATTKRDLYDQIEEVIASGKLPSHISDDLHAVRNIGNFSVHEIKSKSTGSIVEVEAGEAEWNLDVLESLFDFYLVEPTKALKRKAQLNKKLKDAGKREIP